MSKKLHLVLIGAAVVFLAMACVSARTSPSTPLYTMRMEQASSEMNFLPTAVESYNYTAESGYSLNCTVTEYRGGATPLGTEFTCGGDTCQPTCLPTCRPTCWDTCPKTCVTCAPECVPQP
jgi:hypothetical protein